MPPRAARIGVEILDRRVFPLETRWVRCVDVEQVAVAIETMVTQSSGPLFAATAGMVLAARAAAPAPGLRGAHPLRARIQPAGLAVDGARLPRGAGAQRAATGRPRSGSEIGRAHV